MLHPGIIFFHCQAMVYGNELQEGSRYGRRMDDETTQASVQMERYATGVVKAPPPKPLAEAPATIPDDNPVKKKGGFFGRRNKKSMKGSASSSKKQISDADISGDSAAKAAADELAENLEAMGYDLNCESFLSKGSHSAFLNQEDRYMEAQTSSEENEKDDEVRENPEEEEHVPEKTAYQANAGVEGEIEMLNEEDALIGLLQQQNENEVIQGERDEDLSADEDSSTNEESEDGEDSDDSLGDEDASSDEESEDFSSASEKEEKIAPSEKTVQKESPETTKAKFSMFGLFTNRSKKEPNPATSDKSTNSLDAMDKRPIEESMKDTTESIGKVEAKESPSKNQTKNDVGEKSTLKSTEAVKPKVNVNINEQPSKDMHQEDPNIPKELVVVKPQRSRRPAQVQARRSGAGPKRSDNKQPKRKLGDQQRPSPNKSDMQVFHATESRDQTEAPHPEPEEAPTMGENIQSPTDKKRGVFGKMFQKANVASKVKVSSSFEGDEVELVLPQNRFSSPFKRRSRSKSPSASPRRKGKTEQQLMKKAMPIKTKDTERKKGAEPLVPKQTNSGESTVIHLLEHHSTTERGDAKEKSSSKEGKFSTDKDEKKEPDHPLSPHRAAPTLTGSFVDYFTSFYSGGPTQETTQQSRIPDVLPLSKRAESQKSDKEKNSTDVEGLPSLQRKAPIAEKKRMSEGRGRKTQPKDRNKQPPRSSSSRSSSRRKPRHTMDGSVSYVVRDTTESTKKRPVLSEKRTPLRSPSVKRAPSRSASAQHSTSKKSTDVVKKDNLTSHNKSLEKAKNKDPQQQHEETDQAPPTLVIQVPKNSASRKKLASKGPMRSPPARKNRRAAQNSRTPQSSRPKMRSDRSTASNSKLERKLAEGSELMEKLKLNKPEPNPQLVDLSQLEKVSLPADWAELNEAARTIEQMMSDVGEGSNGSMDDAEVLLKSQTNMQDVEKALGVLRKHAKKLGVRESDLLLATNNSYDSAGGISEMSMNSHGMLAESFLDVFFGGYFHK